MPLKIEQVPVEKLTFDPSNARKHSDANLAAIAESLKQFGQRKPIVVNAENVIVAGNGTVEAARLLGLTDVDVVRVPKDWSADQVKAFALADNRSAELAEWNLEVLSAQLLELDEAGFDIEALGFELIEPVVDIASIAEDEIVEEAPPRTALGDVWTLGQHRVVCGDSSKPELIEMLMRGEKADLIFTDPPYRLNVTGGNNQWVGQQANKVGDSIKEIADFDPQTFLSTLRSYFAKNMNAYIFCNKELVPDYLNWAIENKYAFNVLIWKKPNALPIGDSHRPDLEYIIFIRKNAIWNNGLQGVNYSKLLEFSRDTSALHPTMKPLGLIANELLISSNKNSIVVDPFLGSGSTLIAAEQTGRICYGFELEPKYCDVIIQRWETLTGQKAVLENASR